MSGNSGAFNFRSPPIAVGRDVCFGQEGAGGCYRLMLRGGPFEVRATALSHDAADLVRSRGRAIGVIGRSLRGGRHPASGRARPPDRHATVGVMFSICSCPRAGFELS